DDPGPGEEAQPLVGKRRAVRAEGRQAPGDRREVVEDALAEKRLALAGRALVAEHGPLAPQRQVLRPLRVVGEAAADEPDRLSAPELRDDDPPGQVLAQVAAVALRRAMEQAELLGGAQARPAAQVGFERVPVGVPEGAVADHPVRQAALAHVGQGARLAPQAVLVDGAGRVHDDLLLEREPVPAPLLARRSGWSRGRRACGGGRSTQPLARRAEVEALAPAHELDHVATDVAGVAVPALGVLVDVQVGLLAVGVERAPAHEGPPHPPQLDPGAGDHLRDAVRPPDRLDLVPRVAAGRGRLHQASSPSDSPRRRRGPAGVVAASSASSRGAVVASRCSAGLASMVSATGAPRAKNRPSPLPAASRNRRSSSETRIAAATGSIVVLSCLRSSFIAALPSTVRPWSQPRKSATSWLMQTRPSQYLRARRAIAARK